MELSTFGIRFGCILGDATRRNNFEKPLRLHERAGTRASIEKIKV